MRGNDREQRQPIHAGKGRQMTEMTSRDALAEARTPIHLWIVGGLSLLWNSIGCIDYTMTKTQNAIYTAEFTAEQRAYFDSFPWYESLFWALGVWGAIAGSILLLMRRRHAFTAFTISALGLAGSTVWQFLISDVDVNALMPPEAQVMTVMIWAIALFLFVYSQWAVKRGWLK